MPWQLSGNGRSGWSTKLIRGLKAEAATGSQSRRERCREPTPVTPQYAAFTTYKAVRSAPIHIKPSPREVRPASSPPSPRTVYGHMRLALVSLALSPDGSQLPLVDSSRHVGLPVLATVVGLINVPRSASRSNRTIVSLSSFATNGCRPLPHVSIHLTDESRLLRHRLRNTSMLSCPRLLA
jgi:hypothetical protein